MSRQKKFSSDDFAHWANYLRTTGSQYTQPGRPGQRWALADNTILFIDSAGFKTRGEWERPHSHQYLYEVIMLLEGRAAQAFIQNGVWRLKEIPLNSPVIYKPTHVHAFYLAAGPYRVQVLKAGKNATADWQHAGADADRAVANMHPIFSRP